MPLALLLLAAATAHPMVEGILRYLQRLTPDVIARAEPSRERLAASLGVIDPRLPFTALELLATTDDPALLHETPDFRVFHVRWPVLEGVSAQGLYFQPKRPARCRIVAIPDLNQEPEQFPVSQRLAASGCEVLSFPLIRRTSRDFVYRLSYMVGRHLIGYEVQKALAAVDWYQYKDPAAPIGLYGSGTGAMIAQFAAELDPRITTAALDRYDPPGADLWKQPIDYNVWDLHTIRMTLKNVQKSGDLDPFLARFDTKRSPSEPVYLQVRSPSQRHLRHFREMIDHSEALARRSERVREKLWADLPALRDKLWNDVLGRLPEPTIPLNARVTKTSENDRWEVFNVVYDIYPEVSGYGLLLRPKNIPPAERRPAVVAQHGLEGTPENLIDPKNQTYANLGGRLADLGYVVFLPQNPYIGGDKFRVINRLANPLGLSMFSFIIAQHGRLLDWLSSLPYVNPDKIGFYGLSYGGKTALRVPPFLPRYAAVVCSGDFNEWIHKTTSTEAPYSYLFTREWEMPEFNLAHVANHAEMAMLIAPRPFMVERGHRDGVGADEWVAYEYAKVKRYYDEAGIGDRTAIEFFNGPHRINGVGTLEFLRKWLGR